MNAFERIEKANRILEFSKQFEDQPEVHILLLGATIAMADTKVGMLLALAIMPIIEATEVLAKQVVQYYKAKWN